MKKPEVAVKVAGLRKRKDKWGPVLGRRKKVTKMAGNVPH